MVEFKVIKKSKKSRARIAILKTKHGVIKTPCLVPVATQASIKTLDSDEIKKTKTKILIANAFHLHLRPGEKFVKKAGGIHNFMNWQDPLITDSGGFQVFSLGFGKDLGFGKILKYFDFLKEKSIKKGQQPSSLKITDEGVYFRSFLDGKEIFLSPKKSIKIQEKLGADIIFTFDECTPPSAEFSYAQKSLERTHKWAKVCLITKKSRQAMFGIIQGSRFKKLREESARFINSLDFDGFGIGGDLGKDKKTMKNILNWTIPYLDPKKPRHLLGIGYLEDIENIVKLGVDLFDCTVPTHYARRGVAFVSSGKLNLSNKKFLKEKEPLDKKCGCYICLNYRRNYISHLLKAKEITAFKLLTFHNLYFFNSFVEKVREKIKKGII